MEGRVGYALKRAQAALRGMMDTALAGHALTTAQYAALAALEADPGLSNAELARRSFVTPQTMIQVLALLERDGLVERSPGRGRVLETRLTAEGAARVAAAHATVEGIEARMLAGLDADDTERLLGWLHGCADRIAGPPADGAEPAQPPERGSSSSSK
jgi:DNA-binding MarR family transcriptional regulator